MLVDRSKPWQFGLFENWLTSLGLRVRLKAAAIHLGISALIAALAASLVFGLWYPWPYRLVSGGQALFIILISVDLILGPTLTFVVFNRAKAKSHLIRDLVVIAVLQLAGLGYGLHAVFLARPVAMVFEVDRFHVVSDIEVLHSELPQALPGLRELSLTGPKILGARAARSGDERLNSIVYALQGFDIGTRPIFWQPYADSIKPILERARPVSALYKQYPNHVRDLDRELGKIGRTASDLKFLPLMARESNWSVLLDKKTAEIVGFVPYDGFLSDKIEALE
jgi:hypothetical protein